MFSHTPTFLYDFGNKLLLFTPPPPPLRPKDVLLSHPLRDYSVSAHLPFVRVRPHTDVDMVGAGIRPDRLGVVVPGGDFLHILYCISHECSRPIEQRHKKVQVWVNSTRSYLIIKINALFFYSKSFAHFIRWFEQGCGSVFIWYGSGSSILGRIPIRIQGFWWPKIGKMYSWKKITFFWIKNYNLPIPGPPYRTSKLQKKPSALKREHTALQNMKFLNFFYFCGSFLPSWIADPDSLYGSGFVWPDWIRIQLGSGSATLILNDLYLGIVLLRNEFAKKSPMSVRGWPPCLHKFANLQGY